MPMLTLIQGGRNEQASLCVAWEPLAIRKPLCLYQMTLMLACCGPVMLRVEPQVIGGYGTHPSPPLGSSSVPVKIRERYPMPTSMD